MSKKPIYTIIIETHFSAAHQLHGYPGHCGRLHGHTWKIRVEVETGQTDGLGIGLDFKQLKGITETALQPLDHHHINTVPPFDRENPTAENLSRFLYRCIQTALPRHARMVRVVVWESDNYAVDYRES